MEGISTRMISSISRNFQYMKIPNSSHISHIIWYKKNFKSMFWFSCSEVSNTSPQGKFDFGAMINGGSIKND
jgi:hypothetical protein